MRTWPIPPQVGQVTGRALLGTRTVARLAVDQGRHADADRGAAHRFFQVQLQGVAQVAAALSAATRATAATAEEVAEDIAEDVGEVAAKPAPPPPMLGSTPAWPY
jgi:hypothetical protein